MALLAKFRNEIFPKIDPPGEDSWFRRHARAATRDRTPWNGPDEYVYTVDVTDAELSNALTSAGYADPWITTVKYVQTRAGGIAWEQGTLAAGKWDRGGENQHHAYWFDAADGRTHVHHHREWPTAGNPYKHQNGSRTFGDPDDRLLSALQDADIRATFVDQPSYNGE